METKDLLTIISPFASIILAGITYYFAKQKDREADRRKLKIDHYDELAKAMSKIVASKEASSSIEARRRFMDACNTVLIIASPKVVIALKMLFYEITKTEGRDKEKHDRLLTNLMIAIREDIGVTNDGFDASFRFLLMSAE